jgi:hypothetical protein
VTVRQRKIRMEVDKGEGVVYLSAWGFFSGRKIVDRFILTKNYCTMITNTQIIIERIK